VYADDHRVLDRLRGSLIGKTSRLEAQVSGVNESGESCPHYRLEDRLPSVGPGRAMRCERSPSKQAITAVAAMPGSRAPSQLKPTTPRASIAAQPRNRLTEIRTPLWQGDPGEMGRLPESPPSSMCGGRRSGS
jgi:hypothetical protein